MGPVVRVLMNLIKRQGLGKAVKTAQKLGFRNSEIKQAVGKIGERRGHLLKPKGVRPKKTFAHRKADRINDPSRRGQDVQEMYEKHYDDVMGGGGGRPIRGHEGFGSYEEMMRNNPFGKFGRGSFEDTW